MLNDIYTKYQGIWFHAACVINILLLDISQRLCFGHGKLTRHYAPIYVYVHDYGLIKIRCKTSLMYRNSVVTANILNSTDN